VVVRRFEVWVASLDPVVGSEMQKPRPAVVISPDEMNNRLNTVLVAPLTRRGFVAPFRVPCQFAEVTGQIGPCSLRGQATAGAAAGPSRSSHGEDCADDVARTLRGMNRHLSRELLPAPRLGVVATSRLQSRPGSAFHQFNDFTLQRF